MYLYPVTLLTPEMNVETKTPSANKCSNESLHGMNKRISD